MRVLFIVEAGFKVGMGHLLRSRALLLELHARSHMVDLWLYGDNASLAGRGWPEEMQVFRSVESESVGTVCDGIAQLIENNHYDWIVIDGYGFSGHGIFRQLAAHGTRLLILDDLANRELQADIVLNQNTTHQEIYVGSRVVATRFLLGPEYALIDRAYVVARDALPTHGALRRLLVTFGGVDRNGRTQRVIDLISHYEVPLEIVVVVGPYYPYLDKLKSWRGRHALRVEQNMENLADYMLQCDLMITAAGSTVWQGCCIGVPMMVLQTVDNQRHVIKTLLEFSAALCLDASVNPQEGAGIQEPEFTEVYSKISDAATRSSLSANALRLVDGRGAGRVAEELENWE